jgi:hypothetical protein
MHDFSTVKQLSDKELSDRLRTLDRKLGCVGENEQLFNLLYSQKEIIMDEQRERNQFAEMSRLPTYDTSIPYEDKDKK